MNTFPDGVLSGADLMRQFLPTSPYIDHLGMQLRLIEPDVVELVLPSRKDSCRHRQSYCDLPGSSFKRRPAGSGSCPARGRNLVYLDVEVGKPDRCHYRNDM